MLDSGNPPKRWIEDDLKTFVELSADDLAQKAEEEGFKPQLEHIDTRTKVTNIKQNKIYSPFSVLYEPTHGIPFVS